jgi:dCMP deaminase
MGIADLTSKLSYAKRLNVGAVIVKGNQIIGTGYNGMPTGWENNCELTLEDGTLKTKPEVLHAESNAIAKVSRSTESSEGATLFCTHAPCIDCAKLIYQAGISTVYYRDQYRDDSGLKFLSQGNVNVHQYFNKV